jgi:uncharacterized protein
VALSGGVDSAVVACLARRALGSQAVAVTLSGPAVARSELDSARTVAREVGIGHRVVRADPLENDDYRSNSPSRCYFCRVVETRALLRIGRELGVRQYLDGIHVDDLGDDRPGLRAMDEAGFRHPLLDAGWRKVEVRAFAHSVSLSVADRPSNACLASRVRHGQPISVELLQKIEVAEAAVASFGFRRVRVRWDGVSARVQVGADEVARLLADPLRTRVRVALGAIGMRRVELDPVGYRPRPGM